VLEALKGFKSKILKTSLTVDKEEELREVLEKASFRKRDERGGTRKNAQEVSRR
jgi:uncharacterized membrane protein